jgi:oxaloacetate decarboxylase gamma subunit
MTIPFMFEQSAALAALGMTMVFGFLVIMVICVTLSGKIIHAIGADKDTTESAPRASSPADSGAVTAVISAAVSEYRKNT